MVFLENVENANCSCFFTYDFSSDVVYTNTHPCPLEEIKDDESQKNV